MDCISCLSASFKMLKQCVHDNLGITDEKKRTVKKYDVEGVDYVAIDIPEYHEPQISRTIQNLRRRHGIKQV